MLAPVLPPATTRRHWTVSKSEMARRIAIVEDEAAIRENYADVLRKQGYEVQTFSNRKDAMRSFDIRLPNLAIIDIGLENEIDGGCGDERVCAACCSIIGKGGFSRRSDDAVIVADRIIEFECPAGAEAGRAGEADRRCFVRNDRYRPAMDRATAQIDGKRTVRRKLVTELGCSALFVRAGNLFRLSLFRMEGDADALALAAQHEAAALGYVDRAGHGLVEQDRDPPGVGWW